MLCIQLNNRLTMFFEHAKGQLLILNQNLMDSTLSACRKSSKRE